MENPIANMNKDAYEAWVAALREPGAKQTQGALRDTSDEKPGECCLGVLCRVATTKGVELSVGTIEMTNGREITVYDGENMTLPMAVSKWAGFVVTGRFNFDHNPTVWVHDDDHSEGGYFRTVAELNDEGWSFEEIATVIEVNRELDWSNLPAN